MSHHAAIAVPLSAADFNSEALPLRDDLFGAAMRMTRNAADAEDLVQDTFARALRAWDRYVAGSNCRAWLLRILTNSFINNYRRKRRHRRFTHESGDDALEALYAGRVARSDKPQEAMVVAELSDEVQGALARLGDEQRQVVVLADLEGARYRDIATQLDIPIGTVMSRLYRARRQLEQQLSDYAASDYGIRRVA